MENKITVIILIYEENLDTIYECLKSIKNYKIIIIDNANDAKRKDKIQKDFRIDKYFLNKKNFGFSKAINVGIKNCSTDYLLILNPDCIISEKSIDILLESLDEYQDCFMTTPTLLNHNNEIEQNASMFPETGITKEPINIDGDICCQSVLAAAMMFRTEEIIKIGLFDENFFLFYEDDDLCKRIRNLKKSIIQIYNAKAIHIHGQGKSIKNSLKKSFIINYNMTYSELYYFFKINNHQQKLKELGKKIISYSIKTIINLLIFRFKKSIYYFSKALAFYKFTSMIKKKSK